MKLTRAPTRMKVLVVDDDAVFRMRLSKALSARGFEAQVAATVAEALALARASPPQRAIVDLRMGNESGLQLVRRLVELDRSIRVVVLTGYGSIATAVEALRLGAVNYITKPADTDQILSAFEVSNDGGPADPPASTPSLARVEWEHIQRILNDCGGNISEASRRLGIHRRSLQRKLSKLPPLE
jgi:two-component system response regulator RegA